MKVWAVQHVGSGEGLLHRLIAVEDNSQLSANTNAEDVSKLVCQLGEGLAQMEDIKEWQIAQDGNTHWSRGQMQTAEAVAVQGHHQQAHCCESEQIDHEHDDWCGSVSFCE
jgi:hypothetical protein